VRDAIGGLGVVEAGIRDLVKDVATALERAAEWAEAGAKENALNERHRALTSRRLIRNQIQATLDKVIDAGTFVRTVHNRPLFSERFRLKLLRRPPIGHILVHWDKRDDDSFNWSLATESAAVRERVSRYCSAEGRQRHGMVRQLARWESRERSWPG
jgi:hypothetical protein